MKYKSLESCVGWREGGGDINFKERGEEERCLSLGVRSQRRITFLFTGWLGRKRYVPGNLEKWDFDL